MSSLSKPTVSKAEQKLHTRVLSSSISCCACGSPIALMKSFSLAYGFASSERALISHANEMPS